MIDPSKYDGLSDEEFCRLFARAYLDKMDTEKDEDYEINRPQWAKMIEVLDYFQRFAEKSNGKVEPCEVVPRFLHGGVTASFVVMDIKEEDIPAFCEAISKSNAITIDATSDCEVCISLSIPDVFRKKQK